ncbi:MAG TPA: hypothetical protein PKN29_12850 [Candidatus Ozemobacteraceae bacterium]|nr:hypothetical protein [Candidatus Ozemobacteraceae bacterium]
MTKSVRRLLIFLVCAQILAPALCIAGIQPWLEQFVRNVALPGDSYPSLALDMHLRLPESPVHLFCRLRFTASDSYSLQVFDARDETPIMVIADQMTMINDPFAEKLTIIASSGVVFELLQQGEQVNANFSFNQPVDGVIKNRIDLDFKKLFAQVDKDLQLHPAENNLQKFSGQTVRGNRCLATFNASAPLPLQSLQLFIAEAAEPVLEFSLLQAGSEGYPVAKFPSEGLQQSGLAAAPAQLSGFFDTMGVMTSVLKAVFARAAIHEPSIREKVGDMLKLVSPDWEKMQQNDSQRREKLRELFPLR